MIDFRRAFVLATLLGVGAGLALQRCTRERPELPTESPTNRTLPQIEIEAAENSLSGRILEPDGGPAIGAAVIATTSGMARSDTTDETGRFRLRGLDRGEARIDLVHHGFRPQSHAVVVPSAELVTWTLRTSFEEVEHLPELAYSDRTGRLVPPPRVPGFEVWLEPVGDFGAAALEGVFERRADVSLSGEFAFDDLAHGAYELALLPPFARGATWPRLVGFRIDHGAESEPIDVPSSSSSLVGTLTGTDGEPIGGGRILVSSTEDPDHLWPLARSGPDGSFRVPYLIDGGYRVEISAGAASVQLLQRVPRGVEQRIEIAPLEVRPGP